MNNKLIGLAMAALIFAGCHSDTQKIDLEKFEIRIPKTWKYIPQNGERSFTGEFMGIYGFVTFDYSPEGYANGLVITEKQFLADPERWIKECYFCKPGIKYVPKQHLEKDREAALKQSQITGLPLVKIDTVPTYKTKIHKITKAEKLKYPTADYMAELTLGDSSKVVPIVLPGIIKLHNITIDTTDKFIIKTIWPKLEGFGATGVYYKSRTSKLNFNIVGNNLTGPEQRAMLAAFKTIKIKEQ